MGSYLYSREAPKEERLDVLGLFPWVYKGARNILGGGLGLNKPRVLLYTYCASNSWLYRAYKKRGNTLSINAGWSTRACRRRYQTRA